MSLLVIALADPPVAVRLQGRTGAQEHKASQAGGEANVGDCLCTPALTSCAKRATVLTRSAAEGAWPEISSSRLLAFCAGTVHPQSV